MKNLSPLFHSSSIADPLLAKLELTDQEKRTLRTAKDLVRKTLKAGLAEQIRKALPQLERVLAPRFFTQGSYSYKTINRPWHNGQQIDLDDGCYLPLSFAKGFEVDHASTLFFAAVDSILGKLAEGMGWELITKKPTCTRLELNSRMHIDVPLYVIPDEEFIHLIEARAALSFSAEAVKEEQERRIWADLPQDCVLLAVRTDENWWKSDPRPIADWVKAQAEAKGEQWRRTVRYLKAWRDSQWPNGGPTSICLMAAMDQVFEEQVPRRDDLALLQVANRLPSVLEGDIYNPTDDTELLSRRFNEEEGLREETVGKMQILAESLDKAINGSCNEQRACSLLREQFGERFPDAPEAIQTVSAEAVVASTSPRINTSRPVVKSTHSG